MMMLSTRLSSSSMSSSSSMLGSSSMSSSSSMLGIRRNCSLSRVRARASSILSPSVSLSSSVNGSIRSEVTGRHVTILGSSGSQFNNTSLLQQQRETFRDHHHNRIATLTTATDPLLLVQRVDSYPLPPPLSSSSNNSNSNSDVPRDGVSSNGGTSTSSSFSHSSKQKDIDHLIVVGSGVAGCSTALIAAECYNIPVTIVFAGAVPTDCNSYWAQGGIIYRNYDQQSGDSAELLSQDIHKAGAGLCQPDAVWKVATEGPDRVRQLLLDNNSDNATDRRRQIFANVPFDVDPKTNELSLCLEASHAAPRILHNADHTGATITQHITAAAAQHPLITLKPHTVVTDLIVHNETCVGIETLDRLTGTIDQPMYTNTGVVLASGGLAGIYEHSTNPAGFNALGSSVALATRASAKTQDLEFVQFHPTALYIPGEARFLLTEALRGEGAILRDASGRAFASEYHPDAELAPRDIVARAVFSESQKLVSSSSSSGANSSHNVFLDITHRDSEWLHQRFPTIHTHLSQRGYDLGRDQLPIIPAAHYTCGGIATDLHGRTSVRGLYAAGEAARTGLHGGNRLASTSLLEGLVFGASVADYIGSEEGRFVANETTQLLQQVRNNSYYNYKRGKSRYNPNAVNNHIVPPHYQEPYHIENASHRAMQLLTLLRKVMWDYVGVVRVSSGLNAALEILQDIQQQADTLHQQCPTLETAAVRDAATAGYAVAQAARANTKSVGAHCIVEDTMEQQEYSEDEEEQIADMRM